MFDEVTHDMITRDKMKKNQKYDCIIVGGGPAGLFAAYYLCEHSDLRVLLIEKGKAALNRKCPSNASQTCLKCEPCNILCGIGGAGLFSDGKLNYIYKLGKTDLTQFMQRTQAQAIIDETEQIFDLFGMDGPVYPTDMDVAKIIRKKPRHMALICLSLSRSIWAATICRTILQT